MSLNELNSVEHFVTQKLSGKNQSPSLKPASRRNEQIPENHRADAA
jgi:hypothetical protein